MRFLIATAMIFVMVFATAAFGGEFATMNFPDGTITERAWFDVAFPEGPDRSVTIPQAAGWPKVVPGSATFANMGGLVIANIDGDADLEIILGTPAQKLYAWKFDGTEIFSVSVTGPAQGVVAVGDVSGDAAPEIVVTTRESLGGHPTPTVSVFSGGGIPLASASMAHGGSLMAPPTLADLNDDGKKEIIIGESGSSAGWVYALKGDLSVLPGEWPVQINHVPAASAAAGDIDNDGAFEVVFCSYTSVYGFEADGSAMDGFPVTFAGESYSYGSPALADLDGDGKLEIITTTHGTHNRVHAVQYDGGELTGWPYDLGDNWTFNAPSAGDLDGDGVPEVIAGRSGGPVADYGLFFINADGSDFGNSPFLVTGGVEGNFVVADFTGDERAEVVFTTNLQESGKGYLYAVDADGAVLEGWPVRPEGFTYLNGATLADVNGDGVPEFGVIGAKSDGTISVNLYSYEGYFFGPGGVQWRTYQADDQHTGRYQPVYPDDDSGDDTGDDTTSDDTVTDDDTGDDDTMTDDDTADDTVIDDDAADDTDEGADDSGNDTSSDGTGAGDGDEMGGCGC